MRVMASTIIKDSANNHHNKFVDWAPLLADVTQSVVYHFNIRLLDTHHKLPAPFASHRKLQSSVLGIEQAQP